MSDLKKRKKNLEREEKLVENAMIVLQTRIINRVVKTKIREASEAMIHQWQQERENAA
jgi:hypothetical protein